MQKTEILCLSFSTEMEMEKMTILLIAILLLNYIVMYWVVYVCALFYLWCIELLMCVPLPYSAHSKESVSFSANGRSSCFWHRRTHIQVPVVSANLQIATVLISMTQWNT